MRIFCDPKSPEHAPWCHEAEYGYRTLNFNFQMCFSGWDHEPTKAELHGEDPRPEYHRFINCWSRLAFDKKSGKPWSGVQMKKTSRCSWKMGMLMKNKEDHIIRHLNKDIKDWHGNISRIATKLLRGRGHRRNLTRESGGMSVRWSSLCKATLEDKHFYNHPMTER